MMASGEGETRTKRSNKEDSSSTADFLSDTYNFLKGATGHLGSLNGRGLDENRGSLFGSMRQQPDPNLLNTLYYSDSDNFSKEVGVSNARKNWIVSSYGQIAKKSEHKYKLLKLIEFNKVEIVDNNATSLPFEHGTEIEFVMSKLVHSRFASEELVSIIEEHEFECTLAD